MKGYNVVTEAVPLLMLQRLVQWDPVSMLTRQTGWCYMMSSREHTESFVTLICIGLTQRKKKSPFIKMTMAALVGPAARQIRICPTAQQQHHRRHHHRHTNRPTTVYVTQTNTPATQRKTSSFFSFFFKKRKNAKMKRCAASYQAPSVPFHAGSLRNTNSRVPALGKQTKTNEYLIFSKQTFLSIPSSFMHSLVWLIR